MRSKTDTFDSLTVFIALGNKEKLLKTHLNSQSYCLRKVPGQTCEAGFRGTCFQASRSDSIHSCDLLCFSLAAVLATPFKLSPVRHFQLRVNCRLKKELPCGCRGCLGCLNTAAKRNAHEHKI